MRKFLMLLFGLLLVPLFVLATEVVPEVSGGFDPEIYVITFLAFISSVGIVVEILSVWIKLKRAVLIWVVSLVIGILAFLLKLGIFYDAWYFGVLYIGMAGAVMVGYLDAEKGQLLIDLIKSFFKKKEPNN